MKNLKISIYIVLIIIGLVSLNKEAFGQEATGEYNISGIVADSATQKPLDYITISLMNDSNVVIKKGLTKTDGSFAFLVLTSLKYSIVLTSAGHTTKTIVIDLKDNDKRNTDIGIIYISPVVKNLNEIVVTANRPLIRQEAGRITYDLQADPESKVLSVLEIMRKVPFLSADASGNILLKGNSSYKILINGKPSSMVERNPTEILRSMPASTIQKIEVITTPPAKYDAEGLAGIINIITNKKISNGYNGSINIYERFPAGGPGLGGSFTVKQGKFGISGFGGASMNNNPETGNSMNRITSGTSVENLDQESTRKSDGRNGYFGTELSYEIDSLNLISGQFNLNGGKSEGNSYQRSLFSDESGILQSYNLANNNNSDGHGADAAVNYQLGFKNNKNRILTFSSRYYRYNNDQYSRLTASDRINFMTPDYRQANNETSSEKTFQVDYMQTVKNLNIEAGIKGILRDNNSDFQYSSYDSAKGDFEIEPSLSNKFNNKQNVFGAYNTYHYNIKSWEIMAGVRIEQTVINAEFISTSSKIKQNYFNVIPSVSINKKFKDNSSLNFGFVQRIRRPGIYRLNPFVDRSNPNFEKSGNPYLRPVLLNDLQLGYSISKKLSVNVGLGYSFFNKLDLRVSVFDSATNVTRSTFENTGKGGRLGIDFNINYPIMKNWSFSLNGNVAYFSIKGIVDGALINNEWLTYFFSPSTGYSFDKGWRANANLTIISRNPTSLQGTSNAQVSSSFSMSKDIVKDVLSFSASANNPFTKYRNNYVKIEGPDFIETSSSKDYFRSFNITLNYRFGKLKEGINKNRRGIVNDDVSNGKGE